MIGSSWLDSDRTEARSAQPLPPLGQPVWAAAFLKRYPGGHGDDGVTALYQALLPRLAEHGLKLQPGRLPHVGARASSGKSAVVPSASWKTQSLPWA